MSIAYAGGCDVIAEQMERFTQLSIRNHTNKIYRGASSKYCLECGREIPAARRAVIKCIYCVTCQTMLERN